MKNALIGGTLLALIEGLGILINNAITPKPENYGPDMITMNAAPPEVTSVVGGYGSVNLGDGAGNAAAFDVNQTTSSSYTDPSLQHFGQTQDKYR